VAEIIALATSANDANVVFDITMYVSPEVRSVLPARRARLPATHLRRPAFFRLPG
jgi:hypothetical protein